ncbi:MAG: hypothetical protein V1696_01665 [Candidatus Jorgensenbacteria bacterium]
MLSQALLSSDVRVVENLLTDREQKTLAREHLRQLQHQYLRALGKRRRGEEMSEKALEVREALRGANEIVNFLS